MRVGKYILLLWAAGVIPLMAKPVLGVGGGVGIRAEVYSAETGNVTPSNIWGGFINPYARLQVRFDGGFALDATYFFMGSLPITAQEYLFDHLLTLRGIADIELTPRFFLSLSLGPFLSIKDLRLTTGDTIILGSGVFSSFGFYLKTNQRFLFGLDGNIVFDISSILLNPDRPGTTLLQRSSVTVGTTILINP